MYRVVVLVAVAAFAAGCSTSAPFSAGFNDGSEQSERAQRLAETSSAREGALGGEPEAHQAAMVADSRATSGQVQLASLDRAPKGTFEKAPHGALADRDYSTTHLDTEAALLILNTYRKQNGLKPLKLNAALTAAAKAHSRDLAKWDRISHFGSDGSNPWDRVKRAGYNARLAAENVGTGQVTLEEVFKGWKESPGHNKNLLLPDAEHMGIALVQEPKSEFKTFWTLVIGAPL